jgi:hypothetical protein
MNHPISIFNVEFEIWVLSIERNVINIVQVYDLP